MEALGLDSTSGHLPVLLVMVLLLGIHLTLVAVALIATGRIRHLLLEMITFVTQVLMKVVIVLFFSPMIHYGMVLAALLPAPVVLSTTLHGFARPSPSPPMTT